MSTNWFHDFFFGSNESAIEALEKLQQMDAEQFQKVFSALKELQKGQLFNAEQIQSMQGHLNSLQERLASVEEKVETLTDTVAEQEKIILTCCIVASVIAIAVISFVGFCIYQGIESEREKQKGLDALDVKFNNLDGSNIPNTEIGTNTISLQDNGLQITRL